MTCVCRASPADQVSRHSLRASDSGQFRSGERLNPVRDEYGDQPITMAVDQPSRVGGGMAVCAVIHGNTGTAQNGPGVGGRFPVPCPL